jgi:endonuclease YncB( thermonuclease family)
MAGLWLGAVAAKILSYGQHVPEVTIDPIGARKPPALLVHEYPARVLRVLDGDTLEAYVDRGHDDYSVRMLRLLDIDTPETDQPGGSEATAFTKAWTTQASAAAPDWPLRIKSDRKDSFGRWLAVVTDTAGRNLKDDLAAAGHVKKEGK